MNVMGHIVSILATLETMQKFLCSFFNKIDIKPILLICPMKKNASP